MAQTHEGAIKVFCKRYSISYDFYLSQVNKGLKWCHICKEWHKKIEFGKVKMRYDGLSPHCKKGISNYLKLKYIPRPRLRGRSFVPARDGDVIQARRRINDFVKIGLIPDPNKLQCEICGYKYGGKSRLEYHHHLGYKAENHEKVIPVCAKCHRKIHRDKLLDRDKNGRFKKYGT
jgi:hypothetical protein